MASRDSVRKMALLTWIKFPTTRPKTPEEMNLIQEAWVDILKDIPDDLLMSSTRRFVAETQKLYPGDDPFAMILAFTKPQSTETQGDCLELALEAVSKFGYMREPEAMRWIGNRSPLIAAAVDRFGYGQLCQTPQDDLAVVRGQLRAIFAEERERANRVGAVLPSAQKLEAGVLPGMVQGPRGGLALLQLPKVRPA